VFPSSPCPDTGKVLFPPSPPFFELETPKFFQEFPPGCLSLQRVGRKDPFTFPPFRRLLGRNVWVSMAADNSEFFAPRCLLSDTNAFDPDLDPFLLPPTSAPWGLRYTQIAPFSRGFFLPSFPLPPSKNLRHAPPNSPPDPTAR